MNNINKINLTFLFSIILLIFTLLGKYSTDALYNSDYFDNVGILVKHKITKNNKTYTLYTLKNQMYTSIPFN